MKKYYVVNSIGTSQEVSLKEYMDAFNYPFYTLYQVENGIRTYDQITQENEDEDFQALGPYPPSQR